MKNVKIALGIVLGICSSRIYPMGQEHKRRLSVHEAQAWKLIGEKKVEVLHGNQITFESSNAGIVTRFHFAHHKEDESANCQDNKEMLNILSKTGVTHVHSAKHQEAQKMVDLFNKLDSSSAKTVAFAQGPSHWATADSQGSIKVNAQALHAGIIGNSCDGKGECTLISEFKTPIIALEFSEPLGEQKALFLAALAEAGNAEEVLLGQKVQRLLKIWKYTPFKAENQEAGQQ